MPPLGPPPTIEDDLLLVRVLYTNPGSVRQAEITFACDASGTVLTPTAIANQIQTAYNTDVGVFAATGTVVGPVIVQLGDGTTVPQVGQSTGANLVGANAIDPLPGNNALLIKKVTALGGKKNRGRFYLPWSVDEGSVDEVGTVLPAVVTATSASVQSLLGGLTAVSCPMVIAHRLHGDITHPTRVTSITMGPAVITLSCESTIGSQRRRIGR
jgi:hypothetical protein